jgi:predicted kinase
MGDNYEGSIRPQLYDCLLQLTEGLLAVSKPAMLEGTFLKPRMRRKVELIAEKSKARLLSVQVECRLSLRESRNERRTPGAHVPDSYLRQAHHLAKEQIRQADFVFDTELHDPERLAGFLLGAVGVAPVTSRFCQG